MRPGKPGKKNDPRGELKSSCAVIFVTVTGAFSAVIPFFALNGFRDRTDVPSSAALKVQLLPRLPAHFFLRDKSGHDHQPLSPARGYYITGGRSCGTFFIPGSGRLRSSRSPLPRKYISSFPDQWRLFLPPSAVSRPGRTARTAHAGIPRTGTAVRRNTPEHARSASGCGFRSP